MHDSTRQIFMILNNFLYTMFVILTQDKTTQVSIGILGNVYLGQNVMWFSE